MQESDRALCEEVRSHQKRSKGSCLAVQKLYRRVFLSRGSSKFSKKHCLEALLKVCADLEADPTKGRLFHSDPRDVGD